MKILHISSATGWRGGEQQLAYLAIELDHKGIKQLVACPANSAIYHFCQKQGISTVTYEKGSSFSFKTARFIKKVCDEHQPTLIHTHDSHAHTYAFLADVIFRNRIPLVISRRVDFEIGKNLLSKIKYNHKRVLSIICVSNAIARIIAPAIHKQSKISVVHDGIDTGKFEKNEPANAQLPDSFKHKSGLFIGNVAAIADHKDYFTFVDTVRILVDTGVQATFFIIGDGPLRGEIEAYIRQKALTEHIVLTGFLNNIPQILPLLDIFLITSKTEGLGSSILDAFAAKVPVVATEAGGIPEIVIDGESGLLAPVKRPDLIAEKVIKLIENPLLREQLIAGAQEILKGFSKEIMAVKTQAIYETVNSSN